MPSLLGLPLKNNDRARSAWSCMLKEVRLGRQFHTQITVFCPPKPRVTAFCLEGSSKVSRSVFARKKSASVVLPGAKI